MERTSPVEFRAVGRQLSGTVVTFGETGRVRREMFTGPPASVTDPLELDLEHDPSIVVASTADGSLSASQGPRAVEVRATLKSAVLGDPGSAAALLVGQRALTGLSVGFIPLRENTGPQTALRVVDRIPPGTGSAWSMRAEYRGFARSSLRALMGRSPCRLIGAYPPSGGVRVLRPRRASFAELARRHGRRHPTTQIATE